jgi:hypothetical protein
MNSKITIGADPELFIVDKSNNKIISSIGIIPGEKRNAYKPEGFPKGFGIQTDNILAEFNIPPVMNSLDFINYINLMKSYISSMVKRINSNYDILCQASADIEADQLLTPESQMFGCDVDYNVYTESVNPKPETENVNYRTTGFHIHLGFMPVIPISAKLAIIKALDLYLGIPSVIIDTDGRRRNLYGKAGCFRLTSYGLEYRVLSGYFLSTDVLIGWVFNQTMLAVKQVAQPFGFKMLGVDWDNVRSIIDTGNVQQAVEICNQLNINYNI